MTQPVDTQLRAYFEQVEESHGPLTTAAILERAAPVQEIPKGHPAATPRFSSKAWAWAAALIVFVGIAILIGTLNSDAPPVDQPSTTTVPSTAPSTVAPTTPPVSGESGTLATSIGPADWWMVSGVDGALPDQPGWVFETPSGYQLVVGPFGGTSIEYWTSPDGTTWTAAPLPEGLSGLEGLPRVDRRQIGDSYWLISESEEEVWRLDGDTWTSVPLPGGIPGSGLWGVGEDQVWLTSGSFLASGPPQVWRLDGQDWTSFDPGISPEDVEPNLVSTGRPIAGNNGVVVIPWSADTMTVIDPDDVPTAVTPPWATQIGLANGEQPDDLTVLAGEEGFVAVVVDWMPGTDCPALNPECDPFPDVTVVTTWTSSDGIEWTGPNQPGFLPAGDGTFSYLEQIETVGDAVFASVLVDESGAQQLWYSEDGLQWEPSELPYVGGLSFDRVAEGWVYFDYTVGPEMFSSPDLREWERVDAPASVVTGDGAGSIMWASTGNTFYVFQAPEGDTPHMWMADFEG